MARALRDIAIVAPNLHRRWSGVTSTIATLVPRQRAAGVAIAALGSGLPADVPRLRFRDILAEGWAPPPGRARRVWHARRNIEMIAGLFLRDVLRQPWALLFTSAAQRRHKALTRALIARMDAVVATSPAAAAYLDVPATIILHGVDTVRFAPAEDRRAAWRALGLPGERGIGVFGRVRANKGTDLFVEAMIRLLPRYSNVTAIVTGLVAAEEAGFAAKLQARAAEAGLAERIRFLGVRPSEEMPALFRAISVYVAPQRWEGFGLTPLEAMASGTAVVATRTGAAPLLVAEGETGALVSPDDIDALTAAIEPLLADPSRAEAMGAAGRAKVLRDHDITGEIAALAAIYERLARGPQ